MRHLVPRPEPPAGPSFRVRRAEFADVAPLLRLIERAVERGCAPSYRPAQRRAVYLSYAQSLFVDVLGPAETFVAEHNDRPLALAQIQPHNGRLSALFVEGAAQSRGLGHALLDWVEAHALGRRLRRLHGAMSLNAVPFYARAGYQPCAGRRELVHGGITIPVLPMEKYLG